MDAYQRGFDAAYVEIYRVIDDDDGSLFQGCLQRPRDGL